LEEAHACQDLQRPTANKKWLERKGMTLGRKPEACKAKGQLRVENDVQGHSGSLLEKYFAGANNLSEQNPI
jgi:hypothetical protein